MKLKTYISSLMPGRKMDSREMGLRIASIFGGHFLKMEHLHYGYWPEGLEVTLENLPRAQALYTEFLLSSIPRGVNSILDVGCGTGHNAETLAANGYSVDCVSPSASLTLRAREKLGAKSKIFECRFEEMTSDKKYDLVLFSESFQYMKMNASLDGCVNFLKPGGHILIADFFKIPGSGTSPMGGGHKLEKFKEIVATYPMDMVSEADITANTSPNLLLVHQALTHVAIPVRDLIKDTLSTNYRFLYKGASFLGRLFFSNKLKSLHYKYFSGNRNAENFAKFKTYRVFLFKLRPLAGVLPEKAADSF